MFVGNPSGSTSIPHLPAAKNLPIFTCCGVGHFVPRILAVKTVSAEIGVIVKVLRNDGVWMQAVVIDLFNTLTLERAERNPEGAAVHPNSHIRVADAQRLESSVVIGRLLDAFKPLD